ncbi:RagB/SusD family nutrient uptake outer membrane protein [Halpernia sp.]|uniref:RagB/SusD family nutrient uptake outer membrane protein n=1 Tax=Halpernia sp. TaxID=2782209 RepID=UPI003A914181
MKSNKIKFRSIIAFSAIALLSLGSCVKDLEREPISDVTSASVFSDFANYPNALAKLYGGLAVGGQSGGDGNSDVAGIDGGFSNYLRQLYTMNVITTDEAVIAWNDGTLQTMHKMTWDSSNEFIGAMYYRIFTEIAFCNEFLRNTTDEKLASNNITGDNLAKAKVMRGEARFIRAQSYEHALDLFGNVPFITETNLPGSTTPPARITRADLFKYVESELISAAAEMAPARTNTYGHADQAAAWSLLARLYLNAKVYTGTDRSTDCITYCKKVIGAGYSLKSNYADLFKADNNIGNNEQIFSINYDGVHTQTYGGSTYMVHASIGGSMPASDFGVNGGWGGLRTTKAFVDKFPTNGADKRGNFYTNGQDKEINDLGSFTDGYAFIKYKNVTSTGAPGSDNSGNFVDTDIPLYRLADIYLMYAEATLRGGAGGDMNTAIGYINQLRERAYGNNSGNVTSINLDFILDERARELSWELTRRTDLIRFGKFTSAAYLWPWKGGVKDGKAVDETRNLFPIPAKDIIANPNLVQNPGY